MDNLRIFLLMGLIVHKLVWEILKRSKHSQGEQQKPDVVLKKRIIKLGKLIFLMLLVIQTLSLNVLPISNDSVLMKFIGTAFYLIGLTVAITGRIQLGNNWVDLEDYQILEGQSVVSKGIYRYIRHPIYTGDLLLLFGLELALNSWLVLVVFFILFYVIMQISHEETLLLKKLSGYEEYRQNTKMMIPFVF